MLPFLAENIVLQIDKAELGNHQPEEAASETGQVVPLRRLRQSLGGAGHAYSGGGNLGSLSPRLAP